MTDQLRTGPNLADMTDAELETALIRFIDLYAADDRPDRPNYMVECFEGAAQSVIDQRGL